MNKQEIRQLLDNLHIRYRWIDHAPVFTVNDSVSKLAKERPIKNLLLSNRKKQLFLIVAFGDTMIDMRRLARQLGTGHLSFANSPTLMEILNVKSGAVSVFNLLNNGNANTVKLYIDRKVMESESEIGFHPNDNTATVLLTPNELKKIFAKFQITYSLLDL